MNPIFLTYAGAGRTSVTAIAATSDAVFLTGSIFGSTLPVTPSAILQSPASGTLQNGFVEKFNSTGSTLQYATYLSGQDGDTAPAAIAADAFGNAYIAGYTTSSGYPTLAALIPNILGATSGFLTKLTPAGDGILFSTFLPGPDITSLAIDPTANDLLLSGAIALGQFPVANVPAPLVDTTYQTLLRLPLDGSAVLVSTLLAPGSQSTLIPAPNSSVWIASNLTSPASLLPLAPLSTIGNSYALRVTQQNTSQLQIDQAIRFGGLPTTNPNYASAPANLTSLTTDPTGQPIFAGSISPTASASLLPTETYDLALYNTPTPLLPSGIVQATLPPGTCNGSLCAGSAAYLAKLNPANLNPTTAAPSLALSTGDLPNLTLRNLGSTPATNLQLSATGYTLASNCPSTFPGGGECSIALTGTGPGSLTAQAGNAAAQTATLPATNTLPNAIVLSPKELDFGIGIGADPFTVTRTVTVTNLSQQPQTFASISGSNEITPYTFAESSSDCPTTGLIATKTLPPNSSCRITLSFTASPTPSDDGFAQSNWTIGSGAVLLTAYTQAAPLNLSAAEVDFGTQYGTSGNTGIRLPRFLYLSNNSATPITHTPVALAPPFSLTDRCPPTLEPHTVCQLQLTYDSPVAPSADSTTLMLDQDTTVLITGSTLPQPTGAGQSVNPNLTLSPASITFPNAVPVTSTSTSSATQTVTIGNTGASSFPLTLALTGDFTDATGCPALLPGNSSCTVVLTFAPSEPGTRQGLLSVTAGAAFSPAYVALSGTGTAILSAANGSLSFGDVLIGQPSVQWYKITSSFSTLTASSSAPDFKAILVEDTGYGHGQPSSAAFQSAFTGSCSNCWLGVQFTPSATGPQTASLTLASSTSGSPSPLALTGTGLPLTGLLLTPATQDFGLIPVHSSTPPILFTLTNQTSSTVYLSPAILTGDFTLSPTPTGGPACNGPLAPNASCFLNILFVPTAAGQRTGALTIPASSGPITAPLSGFGSSDSGLALNPAALIFHNVPGPSATRQTITLTNTGSATLQINGYFYPANFPTVTSCTTLAPGNSCTFSVGYNPSDFLASGTLSIGVLSSISGQAIYTVPLTGAYTTEDAGLQILPTQANFGPNPTSTLGLTRQFTINNLTSKSLTLTLSLPRQFVLTDSPDTCAALAPNASCTFSATFLPLTNGDITGTIFAQATPTDGSATLDGLAYLEGYGNGSATLATSGNILPNPGKTLLDFGQVASGQTSRQTLTLANRSSSTPLTIRRISSEWPFLVTSTTCGSTLAPTQSCTATLTYTPLNQAGTGPNANPQSQQDNGTLVVESDALSGPDFIDLTGTAAPLSVTVPANTAPLVSYTASTSSLTFPATQAGNASAPQIVTLSNTGTATIHIAALQTTPGFTVQSNCATLVPSSSCTLYVTFAPQSSNAAQSSAAQTISRIGALEITSDASSALDFISLLGTALPSPLTLTPLSLNFGSVQVGSTVTLPLQIANTGPTAVLFQSISVTDPAYTVTGNCPAPGSNLSAGGTCILPGLVHAR